MAHDLHRSCGTLPCSAVAAKSGSTAEDTTYTTHTQALGCHSGGTWCRCSVGRSNIFVAPKLCCRCRCRGSCAWRMWRSTALGAVSTAIGRDASPASGIKPRMLHSRSAVLRSKIHLFGVARSHQGLHDTHIYMYIIVIFIITVVIVVISSSSSIRMILILILILIILILLFRLLLLLIILLLIVSWCPTSLLNNVHTLGRECFVLLLISCSCVVQAEEEGGEALRTATWTVKAALTRNLNLGKVAKVGSTTPFWLRYCLYSLFCTNIFHVYGNRDSISWPSVTSRPMLRCGTGVSWRKASAKREWQATCAKKRNHEKHWKTNPYFSAQTT